MKNFLAIIDSSVASRICQLQLEKFTPRILAWFCSISRMSYFPLKTSQNFDRTSSSGLNGSVHSKQRILCHEHR